MSTKTIKPRCRYCDTISYPFGSLCDDCQAEEESAASGILMAYGYDDAATDLRGEL